MAQTKYVDAKDSLNVLNENNKGESSYEKDFCLTLRRRFILHALF